MKPDMSIRGAEYYLDNAATTIMDDEVVEAMQPFLEEQYGNPEMPYHLGSEAKVAVEKARESIAEIIGASPEEIYFTSGGTESNNWAIKGILPEGKRNYQLCSSVEHSSVLNSCTGRNGCLKMDDIPVDGEGRIILDDLKYVFAEHGDIRLVSVQVGNNEVGTLQPVAEVAKLCKEHGTLFHTDACQAFGRIATDVNVLGVDMMTISAHKIHGPMGVGALYIRNGTKIEPLLHGGGQERGLRSGTLAVPNIVGFGKAAELAWSAMRSEMPRISRIIDDIASNLEVMIGAKRNGSKTNRLPHILSLTIPGVEAAAVLGVLAADGICVSAGSACNNGRPSHVLKAMGVGRSDNVGTIRISLSRFTKDVDGLVIIGRIEHAISRHKELEML